MYNNDVLCALFKDALYKWSAHFCISTLQAVNFHVIIYNWVQFWMLIEQLHSLYRR
jgi:hypothetical protein